MGQLNIIENQEAFLDPATDAINTGWVISAGIATHFPCNPGTMINANIVGLVIGETYIIAYDVLNYVSGEVYFSLGTNNGSPQSANVEQYTQGLLCSGNTNISFYSNGQLSVANLSILNPSGESMPFTFSFNEKNEVWGETASWTPDAMLKYGDNFFTFNEGAAWLHGSNPVYGNFYGQQYSASITFLINTDPRTIKLLQGLIIESNQLWWCPNIQIKPYVGKSLGMQSRIKSGRFEILQGVFYADFLRNLLDPRFGSQLQALLYGEELRGRTAVITIQNDSTTPVELFCVQVKYAPQMLTP